MIGLETSRVYNFHWDDNCSTFYRAGDEVPLALDYKNDGITLPTTYFESATHTHKKTGLVMRGVGVKLVGMSPDKADELDDDIFGLS